MLLEEWTTSLMPPKIPPEWFVSLAGFSIFHIERIVVLLPQEPAARKPSPISTFDGLMDNDSPGKHGVQPRKTGSDAYRHTVNLTLDDTTGRIEACYAASK